MTPDASKVELAAKYHGTVSWQFSNQFHNDDSMHTTDRTSPWSIVQMLLFRETDGMDIVCGRSVSARVAAFPRTYVKMRGFSTESPYQPWGSTGFGTHNRAKLDRMGWQSTCFGEGHWNWKTRNNNAGCCCTFKTIEDDEIMKLCESISWDIKKSEKEQWIPFCPALKGNNKIGMCR